MGKINFITIIILLIFSFTRNADAVFECNIVSFSDLACNNYTSDTWQCSGSDASLACSFSYDEDGFPISSWYMSCYTCGSDPCVGGRCSSAPPPSCDDYFTCATCTSGAPFNCGWKNGSVCQTGSFSCPAGATSWQYLRSDCDDATNWCAAPTATPTKTPTPTPIPGITCASICGASFCDGVTCPITQVCCTDGIDDFCSPSALCAAPTATPTKTPTPTPIPGVTCASICGASFCDGVTCLATQVCCTDGIDDFCQFSSACTASPTPTTGATPTTGPTPTPTPDPSVFNVTITLSNSTPAINELVTVTANVSGPVTFPIDLELDCDTNGASNDNAYGITILTHEFLVKCSYSKSGSWIITVNAHDASKPINAASPTATVTVLQRYQCDEVFFTNTTCNPPSFNDRRYCSDSDETKNCNSQSLGSTYISCFDCNSRGGCSSSTHECTNPPPPLPTPKLGLQCKKFDAQNKCETVTTAIGDIAVDPASFVTRIMSLLLGISGGIAILLIIMAGYSIMTSRDHPETLQDARQRLLGAIAGLIFIALALTILEVIGIDILQIPGFER